MVEDIKDYEEYTYDVEDGEDDGEYVQWEEENALAMAEAKIMEEIFPTTIVKFESLVGEQYLSGCDMDAVSVDDGYRSESANVMRFVLNGITYKAIEDPDDGYRSTCGVLEMSYDKVPNMFNPHKVYVRMNEHEDIMEIIDLVTNQVVLELGTDHSDSYYPFCVMRWNPLGLADNFGK
jgi:hypothetical protein